MAAGGEATRDSPSGSRVSEVRAKGRAGGDGDWCDQIGEVEGELAVALCTLAEEREEREGGSEGGSAQGRLEKGGAEE